MTEKWKPVYGYEDCYAVSDRGNIVRTSLTRRNTTQIWRPVKLQIHRDGYTKVMLSKDKVRSWHQGHRLVWETFNKPIKNGMQINHLNGKKADNRLSNLEVCTPSQNTAYSFRVLGRAAPNNPSYGSKNGSAKPWIDQYFEEIIALYATGKYRQVDLAKRFGVSQRLISFITRRENWRRVPPAASP